MRQQVSLSTAIFVLLLGLLVVGWIAYTTLRKPEPRSAARGKPTVVKREAPAAPSPEPAEKTEPRSVGGEPLTPDVGGITPVTPLEGQ